MKRSELIEWLNIELEIALYSRADISMNGLQVGRSAGTVIRVATAVDACMESFRGALQAGADFLIVHHGLFWGKPLALTGTHYDRIAYLIENNLALYACHLPLDAHPRFGNNAGLAAKLSLEEREPFGEYHGVDIGIRGVLPKPLTIHEILKTLDLQDAPGITMLPFGTEQICSVGIISGGAAPDVTQAMEAGLDLYITGEPSHQIYHTCLEGSMNMISGGHYNTETYGPRLLGGRISEELGLETVFIDSPTGL